MNKPEIKLQIGSPVWVFNSNHRVYKRDEKGHSTGGPIWREHWEAQEIIGETSRSWIVGYKSWRLETGRKIGKKEIYDHFGICLSQADLDDRCYVEENSYTISQKVRDIKDADTLRKVAELIGYVP